MCGIAGLIYSNRNIGPMAAVKRMMNSMQSRGPDDEGLVIFQNTNQAPLVFGGESTPAPVFSTALAFCPKDKVATFLDVPEGRVGIGHRRLSILDLSAAGHQPMSTPDGRYWIVYNGEVYNFLEIRHKIENMGIIFCSRTDTEVVLYAYSLWGPECLESFNGMYAFAIWDTKEERLFCARDRVGIKPFYYVATSEYVLFTSDVKALIDSGMYNPSIDPEGFYHGLSLLIAPRPMTAFKDLHGLEQAHWMYIDHKGVHKSHRYWRIPVGVVDYSRSEDSFTEELEERIERSVHKMLVADVPVGTFMSGGVDSTLVTAIAAKHQPGIKAFTLAHEEDTGMNELAQASAVAKMWPITHVVRKTTHDHKIVFDPGMIQCQIEPSYSISPNYLVSKMASESDVVVVLSGLGGDELFAGYGWFSNLNLWRVSRSFNPFLRWIPALPRIRVLKDMSLIKTLVGYYTYVFELFHRSEKERLLSPRLLGEIKWRDTSELLEHMYGVPAESFMDDFEGICYMDILHYVGNHFMSRMDAFTMHFSLEGRFPLLDHELIEFAMSIPSYMKLRDGIGKRILRKVASKYIHTSCLKMSKKGFGLPVKKYLDSPLQHFVHENLDKLMNTDIFSPNAINRLRNFYERGRYDWRRLWQVVSTQLWLEVFSIQL